MILRVCVVIPTFDNPRTISSVVKDVALRTKFPILIVDDGSETPVDHVLYSFEVRQAIEEKRVRLERFSRRRGTGAALRFAVRVLADDGFTHMVVLRGDGSQSAKQILSLVEAAAERPWDLISAGDLGSSYVLYPLFPLQSLRLWSLGRTFALEAWWRLLWRGMRAQELRLLKSSLPEFMLRAMRGFGACVAFVRRPLSWELPWPLRRRTSVSFAWLRPVARVLGVRGARVLHMMVAGMVLLTRPRVDRALNEFYMLVRPDAGWRERVRLSFWHVFGFVERHSVVRVRPVSEDVELIPFLGRLAPVDVEQLSYVRELEKSIFSSPDKWSRLYPYWSMLPPVRSGQNMFYEELEDMTSSDAMAAELGDPQAHGPEINP